MKRCNFGCSVKSENMLGSSFILSENRQKWIQYRQIENKSRCKSYMIDGCMNEEMNKIVM